MDSFDRNDRKAIEAALADPNPNNPIAVAINVRLKALGDTFQETVAKMKELPAEIAMAQPQNAFDEIVLELFAEELRRALGDKVKVVWAPPRQ